MTETIKTLGPSHIEAENPQNEQSESLFDIIGEENKDINSHTFEPDAQPNNGEPSGFFMDETEWESGGEDEDEGLDDEGAAQSDQEEKNRADTTKAQGEALSFTIDVTLRKLCVAISGEPNDSRFRLSSDEKKEFTNITTQLMADTGFKMPVSLQFAMVVIAIYGANLWTAYRLGEEKRIRAKKMKVATKGGKVVAYNPAPTPQNIPTPEEAPQRIEGYQNLPEYKQMRRFYDVDRQGFYTWPADAATKNGTRLVKEERQRAENRPSKELEPYAGKMRNAEICKLMGIDFENLCYLDG